MSLPLQQVCHLFASGLRERREFELPLRFYPVEPPPRQLHVFLVDCGLLQLDHDVTFIMK